MRVFTRKFIIENSIFSATCRVTIFFQLPGGSFILRGKGGFWDWRGMPYIKNGPVICAARRTVHGSFGGSVSALRSHEWGCYALRACADDIKGVAIDSVILGCVLSAGLGQAPARQALMSAGLSPHVEAMHLNKVCGSGMAAVIRACHQLNHYPEQMILAGGMESMSGAPSLINGRFGYRFGHQVVQDHLLYDGLEDRYEGVQSMGCLAENMAQKRALSRERQDEYAFKGAMRALEAQKEGRFKGETVAVSSGKIILDCDETLQRVRPEKIKCLKPAFKENGTITPATASSLADGAAALALTSPVYAAKHDLEPLGHVVGWASFSGNPRDFTLAPIEATQKLLSDISWRLSDVDVWEVNEAFAVVPLAFQDVLGVPKECMNVWGGALALGHPLGASGARILVTLLHVLKHTGGKRGVAAICIGGGEGLAVAVERRDF